MTVHYVDSIPIGFGLGNNAKHNVLLPISDYSQHSREQKFSCDSEILGIERVAQILMCSVDKVRRISRRDLPARKGPGKTLLYLRSEVLGFVKNLPTTNTPLNETVAEILSGKGFDIESAKLRLTEKK